MRDEFVTRRDSTAGPTGSGRSTVPVVVAGAIACKPGNGGEAWVRLSWFDAVRAAGADAWLFEQIDAPTDEQVTWFRAVTGDAGITDRAVLADRDGYAVVAPPGCDPATIAVDVAASAPALLNISGHLHGPSLFDRFDDRVLVDIDPGYTQMWHAQGLEGARVAGHTTYATIGENIGQPDCTIPTCGLEWVPTRQPVNPNVWQAPAPERPARFSTVAAWRGSYGPVEFDGRRYGIKAHEFRKIIDLPGRCPDATFEIALAIHDGDHADRDALERSGWALTDPSDASGSLEQFRAYVTGSAGEMSVAQGMYVDTRSGWFSDRTARYLAAGRPCVVQDTGFGRNIPTGHGLLTFADVDEAADAVAAVIADYDRHADAARRLARTHFDGARIVTDLLGTLR